MPGLIVAIECEHIGYEPFSTGQCNYDHFAAVEDIRTIINTVAEECAGKITCLLHTSPYMRRNWSDAYYTSPDYQVMWQDVVARGGQLGIHLHEEEPDGSCLYYGYAAHLKRVVAEHVQLLSQIGICPTCEATGYFGFNEWLVLILEENKLLVNLDNVGVFTKYTGTDWTQAPARPYFMDHVSIARPGDSRVLAVPLGNAGRFPGEHGLVVAGNSNRYLKSLWAEICRVASDEACFLWIEVPRLRGRVRQLRSLMRFLASEGTEFLVPSEVYARYCPMDITIKEK